MSPFPTTCFWSLIFFSLFGAHFTFGGAWVEKNMYKVKTARFITFYKSMLFSLVIVRFLNLQGMQHKICILSTSWFSITILTVDCGYPFRHGVYLIVVGTTDHHSGCPRAVFGVTIRTVLHSNNKIITHVIMWFLCHTLCKSHNERKSFAICQDFSDVHMVLMCILPIVNMHLYQSLLSVYFVCLDNV